MNFLYQGNETTEAIQRTVLIIILVEKVIFLYQGNEPTEAVLQLSKNELDEVDCHEGR